MSGFAKIGRSGIAPWLGLALCLVALLTSSTIWGQTTEGSRTHQLTRGRSTPTLHVLTFGPGDHPFTKFGHDAIWVHDPAAPANRRDLVFNYGTFRFDSPWLLLDFLKGNLGYWLSYSSLQRTLASYRAANRAIVAQQLQLAPETARRMVRFLYENAKPENKYYRYDYYADNCSTRIRDLLDDHLEGRLRKASTAQASLNFREHTRRLTQGSPGLFFGIDFILGPHVDQTVTNWEAMFLPSELSSTLRRMSLQAENPLVAREQDLLTADRPQESDKIPNSWTWLLMGLALGGVFLGLGLQHAHKWARVSFGLGVASFSLLAGLLGAGLWVLCLYTDHAVTYWNQNVILSPVWALLFPWLCIDWIRQSPRHARRAATLSITTAGLGWLLWLAQPILPQHSEPSFGIFLPVWTALAIVMLSRSLGGPHVLWSRIKSSLVRT